MYIYFDNEYILAVFLRPWNLRSFTRGCEKSRSWLAIWMIGKMSNSHCFIISVRHWPTNCQWTEQYIISRSSVIYELYMCLCLLLLHKYFCPKNKPGMRICINLMQLRIQLFTLTRIWIWTRNMILMKVMRMYDHRSPVLHFEPPRLKFWASILCLLSLEGSWILTLKRMRIQISVFTLMLIWIQIQLPKEIIRFHANQDPNSQPWNK